MPLAAALTAEVAPQMLAAATGWTLAKVGVLTKALLVFSASLSVYVMFSSPSKFGDSDVRRPPCAAAAPTRDACCSAPALSPMAAALAQARAQALAAQIGADIKGRAGQAWGISQMMGLGKVFGSGSSGGGGGTPPPAGFGASSQPAGPEEGMPGWPSEPSGA